MEAKIAVPEISLQRHFISVRLGHQDMTYFQNRFRQSIRTGSKGAVLATFYFKTAMKPSFWKPYDPKFNSEDLMLGSLIAPAAPRNINLTMFIGW
jgi:hypothetical protein